MYEFFVGIVRRSRPICDSREQGAIDLSAVEGTTSAQKIGASPLCECVCVCVCYVAACVPLRSPSTAARGPGILCLLGLAPHELCQRYLNLDRPQEEDEAEVFGPRVGAGSACG
jgi:hypothetical protein